MYTVLMILFVASVVLLIPTILMQSGSGAEAGMFGNELTIGAFGAKSSEVLVKFTRFLVAIFMLSAFFLGFLKVREIKQFSGKTPVTEQMRKETTTPAEQSTEEGVTPAPAEETGPATLPVVPADGGDGQLPVLPQ